MQVICVQSQVVIKGFAQEFWMMFGWMSIFILHEFLGNFFIKNLTKKKTSFVDPF